MAENKALKEFIAEAEELSESVEKKLFDLAELKLEGKESPDLINAIFRDFHSLKGISGMFGFSNLSKLSHQLENFFDKIRLGKLELDEEVLEILTSGKDLITDIIKKISSGGNDDVNVDDFIESISKVFTKTSSSESSGSHALDHLKNVLTEYEEHRLHDNIRKGKTIYSVQFAFSIDEFDERLNEVTMILKTEGEVISTLPKPSDKPGSIIFSIIYASEKTADELPVKNKFNYELEKLSDSTLVKMGEQKQVHAVSAPEQVPAQIKSISNTIRVDIVKLDHLMNIVGELVTQKAEVAQLIQNIRQYITSADTNLALSKVTNALGKKINELQESVMAVRMVPLNQLFEKLERNLKKIAHELKKEVKIVIKGGDTELDKFIIEELGDPLMHIIRNSIDHGIESPSERTSLGKPLYGQIELLAYQKGNYVYIEVKDDGKGIDLVKIRQKLINSGKITPEQEVSDDYLIQAIFTPGFSVKDKATELSGRGVGMDVVKNNLSRVRGMVDVKTQKDRGASVIMTLPLTLIIIQAVIIKTSDKIFAIPVNAVEEVVEIKREDILKISGEEVINLRNAALPISYLERLFAFGLTPDKFAYLIVLKIGEKKAGIVVDEIMGQGDIVIKSMGRFVKVKGLAGATQTGDGRTVLVLDPPGLMEEIART
jgi:two-component system chemotaxis sensor kinase CheA